MKILNWIKLGSNLTIAECFFLYFVLWGSGTLYSTDSSLPLFGMALSFLLVLAQKKVLITSNYHKIIMVSSCFCLLSFFIYIIYTDFESSAIVFKLFFLFLITVLFSQCSFDRNIDRIGYFIKLILLFSFISNIIYIMYVWGGGLTYQISPTTESTHFNYLNMVCFNALPGLEYRNGGIYWEPGMYQVYLTFALLFYLYNDKYSNRFFIIGYLIISIISTFSITGYLVIVIILALYTLKNNKGYFIKILMVCAFVVCLIFVFPYLTDSLTTKATTGSYDTRSNDLFFAFSLFLKSPIFGTGLGSNTYAQAYMSSFGEARQSSNGMTNLLINFGLVGFCFVVRYIAFFVKFCKKNISPKLSMPLIVWIVASINSEPIVYHPFMFLILGIGISQFLTLRYK